MKRLFILRVLTVVIIVAVLLSPLGALNQVKAADGSVVHTTEEDFALGSADEGISIVDVPGDIRLEHKQPSHTDTIVDDFSVGNTSDGTDVSSFDDGEILLDQLPPFSYPLEGSSTVRHTYLDLANDLVYIGTFGGGLQVFNTQGTRYQEDDTLVYRYNNTSDPFIQSEVTNSFVDSERNLIYVSTQGGLHVINTYGTVDPGDDIVEMRYNDLSTPPIASPTVTYSFLDNETNLLYVAVDGGLSVINTQGTISPVDDTLVITYSTTSTPAIADNWVRHVFLDKTKNLLYISTFNGFSIIYTLGTVDPSDDILVATYTTASDPAIANNSVRYSFLDSERNLLYICTDGGLSVIDTQGTVNPADDILVITYSSTSDPQIANSQVMRSFLDSANNLLYVSTWGGVSVINTNGSESPGDDTLVQTYTTTSDPSIVSDYVFNTYLDSENELLYVSTYWGISVVNMGSPFNVLSGSYTSDEKDIASEPFRFISYEGEQAEGQSISVQTRTAASGDIWRNEFDDGLTDEYLGDYYGWSEWGYGTFSTAEENNGTIKLSGIDIVETEAVFWFDTGMPEAYFPVGSTITARVRINSDTCVSENDYMFDDEWNGDWYEGILNNNEWYTISFTENDTSFSRVGFYRYWTMDTWGPGDTFEIDWIQVEPPITWSDWSEDCTDNFECVITSSEGNTLLQYRLALVTDDAESTPVVESVTLDQGFQASGVYQSSVIDSGSKGTEWTDLTSEMTVPEGTTVDFFTRTGDTDTPDGSWSEWAGVNSPISSSNGRYLQYQIGVTTTNELLTPTVSSVTVTFETLVEEEPTPEVLPDTGKFILLQYIATLVAMGYFSFTKTLKNSHKRSNLH